MKARYTEPLYYAASLVTQRQPPFCHYTLSGFRCQDLSCFLVEMVYYNLASHNLGVRL